MLSNEASQKIVDTLTAGKGASDKPSFIVVGGGMQTGQAVIQKMLIDEKFVVAANTVVIAKLNETAENPKDARKFMVNNTGTQIDETAPAEGDLKGLVKPSSALAVAFNEFSEKDVSERAGSTFKKLMAKRAAPKT